MAVVRSQGALTSIHEPWSPALRPGGLTFYSGRVQDYATIYRTQPNVRTVIGFLARNIAQLGLHVFRRESDLDRVRLSDHGLARTLSRPNPYTTKFRFLEALVSDQKTYGSSYWLKARSDRTGGVQLLRLPPARIEVLGANWLRPEAFRIIGNRGDLVFDADRVVQFRTYNPDDDRVGISPLESLRQILAEDVAAGEYREQFWRSAARMSGVITRPAPSVGGVREWSAAARDRFKSEWHANWAGAAGASAGGTPILEDGMEFKEAGFSARESQFLEARKLTREEVAAVFYVPPTMVGILDRATFSNISEQHKHLYQDTLGPDLEMIQEEIELQLLPEFDDAAGIYVEFNLADKLKGSFEEQAASLQTMTGSPIMTRNEGRARLNLPQIDDPEFDRPVTPLNVLTGPAGDSDPMPVEPAPEQPAIAATSSASKALGSKAPTRLHAAWVRKHEEQLRRYFARQGGAIRSLLGAGATVDEAFDLARWNDELAEDLLKLASGTAQAFGSEVAGALGTSYDVDEAGLPFLRESTRIGAEKVNATTRDQLAEALEGADDVDEAAGAVYERAQTSRTAQIATTRVTAAGNFGRHEAAREAGVTEKTWIATSANPRPTHAALSGESVAIGEVFSNGGLWPGDPTLPAEEIAGCSCIVDFS